MPQTVPKSTAPSPRQLTCASCGVEFACTMDEHCWCAAEPARLPLPSDASDCLCADCLRKSAKPGAPQ